MLRSLCACCADLGAALRLVLGHLLGVLAFHGEVLGRAGRRRERHGREEDEAPHLASASAASIAFSASGALAASGPPPCAMSGRPPPPLPPSAATPAFTSSTALRLFGEIVGDADHGRGLAVLDADQRDHARAQLLLELVGHALEVLARHAVQHAADQLHAADIAHLVGRAAPPPPPPASASALRASASSRSILALAVDQRLQARRQILRPHLQDRRRLGQQLGLVADMRLGRRRRRPPRCGARRPTTAPSPTMRNRPMSPVRSAWVPPHSSTEYFSAVRRRPSTARAPPRRTSRRTAPWRRPRSPPRASSAACRPTQLWRMRALTSSSTLRSSSGEIGLGVADVEAQPVGRHQRALLRDVLAEMAAQRLVQQMGRRMVGAQLGAADRVDGHDDVVADLELALLDLGVMGMQVADASSARRAIAASPLAPTKRPVSPMLAAGFGIERRLVGHDPAGLARRRARVDLLAVDARSP